MIRLFDLQGAKGTTSQPAGGSRFIRVGPTGLMAFFAAVFAAQVASTRAQETDARAALRDLSPPWYSPGADSARTPAFPADEPAVSRDRNLIPEAPAVAPRAFTAPNMNFDLLSPLATWIVLGLLIGLLVFLAWWFLPNRAKGPGEETGASRPDHALRLEQLPVPLEQGIGDLRAAALRVAAEGDFRKAIVYLFSHALVTLDQRGLVELKRGKTNRQYLVELAPTGTSSDRFRGLMLTFERVFFGNHAATEPDFRQCLDATAQLELIPSLSGNGAAR